MQRSVTIRQVCSYPILRLFICIAISACAGTVLAQTAPVNPYYSRVNTFGILAAYSNDSSHILMGQAENRKLLNFGAIYSRRLFQNHIMNWQYSAEVLPVALESDPVDHLVEVFTSPFSATVTGNNATVGPCHNSSGSFNETVGSTTYAYTYTNTCFRQWTIGEGMSPVGFQWNFMPRRKLQPFVNGHGGYMYSTQPIPIANAGSFNFTFDFGAGLEMYRSRTRSVRVEYRYHHISNHNTATQNPGIDNGVLQVAYSFGR